MKPDRSILFKHALTPFGWRRDVTIVLAAGRIASVRHGPAGQVDEVHAIGLPGSANLHSHAFQRGMAGLAEIRGPETDTFWSWRETMYRFALGMTPDDVEAVAAQLYIEMLESGFTRVGEFHYLHHDVDGFPYADRAEMATRLVSAAAVSGINLTLLPVFYNHANFGGLPPTDGQRRFVCDIDGFATLFEATATIVAEIEGARIGVAPHSLRAVTPGELADLVKIAGKRPIHIHAAEQTKEVHDCLAWSGARPVQWLLDNAAIDDRWCLIHATHMTDSETRDLARTGAVAGLCPVTEASLGDGIFPGPVFIEAGGRYGVGTDSNVSVGLAGELRQLEYAQRLRRMERNVLAHPGRSTGQSLFEGALQGGLVALGESPSGLVEGAFADIVSLRSDHPAIAGHGPETLLDAWIFGAGNELVDCVWCRGVKQVEQGRHRERRRTALRFRQTMCRLLAS